MKLRILSDIHLEFGMLEVTELPDEKDTVLVLAGDIGVGMGALPFITEMCERFKHVLYVLGNHEFYHHYVHLIRDNWMVVSSTMPNLTVLDDAAVTIDDTLFLGGTLWTDVHNGDWFAKQKLKQGMNDFRVIKGFGVEQSITAHNETASFFNNVLKHNDTRNTVVVTHHLPHEVCIMPPFAGNPLNPGFVCTDLDYLFDYDIDLWIYGHTHLPTDIEYNGTRLVCNPRGYVGYENTLQYNDTLEIEL